MQHISSSMMDKVNLIHQKTLNSLRLLSDKQKSLLKEVERRLSDQAADIIKQKIEKLYGK